ncbi:translation initiation factor IF-2-like [Manacus candei]|uniref:translation initiation factor IF-2-like n=1 Tax=Manacus candei TaxID=415023 RepID=UPI0022270A0D|nr:translation initiation factor IF-2-like [Manacus candei]
MSPRGRKCGRAGTCGGSEARRETAPPPAPLGARGAPRAGKRRGGALRGQAGGAEGTRPARHSLPAEPLGAAPRRLTPPLGPHRHGPERDVPSGGSLPGAIWRRLGSPVSRGPSLKFDWKGWSHSSWGATERMSSATVSLRSPFLLLGEHEVDGEDPQASAGTRDLYNCNFPTALIRGTLRVPRARPKP